MLDRVFMQILDMSKTGSIVILVVLVARLLLKKAPKAISYALWAVVLLRLLCPVGIEAPVSIVPQTTSVSENYTLEDIPISVAGAGVAAYQAVGDVLNGGIDVQHIPTTNTDETGNVEYVTASWSEVWILFGQYLWLAGVAGMILYSIVSYWKLKKRLSVKLLLGDNIYIADDIDSPFVIGLIKPKIYLPATLAEQEQSYIIAHEQHHIRRCDHVIKVLAFAALVLHWMNPLVWLAFVLAARDMEMSCDEAVIRKLGEEVRGDYAASLLSLATGKRIIAGFPLAFGEGNPKDRIKNLSKWKKPVIWVSVVTVVLCGVLAVCLLTDREGKDSNAGMTFYYGTLVETDGEGFVIEQADGNVLQFNNNEDFTLNANFHIGHYVLVRCNTSERQTVADVDMIEPISSTSLEEAVDATIKQVHSSRIGGQGYACTNLALIDKETKEGEYVILYGLALYQVYQGHLEMVIRSSECHDVVAIKFLITDAGEYVLAEYWEPRSGEHYSADIAAKFPGGEVPYTQEYIDAQRETCREQAKLYFDKMEQQLAEEQEKQEEIKQEAEKAEKPTEGTEPAKNTEPTVPAEYAIPDGIAGVVTYAKMLEEIDADNYTPKQAANDGCVVMIDGDVVANENIWIQYTVATSRGEAAKVRLAEYDNSGNLKRLYELVWHNRGHIYRLLKKGSVEETLYKYLALNADGDYDGGHYNMFQLYALTNQAVWQFEKGVPYDDSMWGDSAVMAFCNLYQRYDYAPIPNQLQCAEIRNQDGTVAVIWDRHKLEKLMEILGTAQGDKGWPKTIELGATLVLTGTDGKTVEAAMMTYSAMIEIDGVFYNYDPGWKDEYTIESVLSLFGLSEMP